MDPIWGELEQLKERPMPQRESVRLRLNVVGRRARQVGGGRLRTSVHSSAWHNRLPPRRAPSIQGVRCPSQCRAIASGGARHPLSRLFANSLKKREP